MTPRFARTILAAALITATPCRLAAQRGPDSPVMRRTLAADTTIDGTPCARSGRAAAEFHPSGQLAGCALSRAHAVGAHAFPAGTWLDFDARGAIWGAWLATDRRLGAHTCRGEGFKAWSVRFHANGSLAGCYLANDTVVEGVPCMRGTFLRELRGGGRSALQLHADGRLRSCQVARDTVVAGRALRKWEVVRREGR